MQIQSDYRASAGLDSQTSHTHHMTQCLHEEGKKKQQGAAASVKMDTYASSQVQVSGEKESLWELGESGEKKTSGLKKGIGLMKGIWDSMGDENQGKAEDSDAGEPQTKQATLAAASSAIKQLFSNHIVNRWEALKDKIRVGAGAALRRFGRGSGAFGALSDPQARFSGKRGKEGQLSKRERDGTRRGQPEISQVPLSDSHLMDSYSKTGEYCRLNDHLSYQKSSAKSREREESANAAEETL